MRCEIILENGRKNTFVLNDAQVRRLEHEAQEVRKAHLQIYGERVDYNIEDEIMSAIWGYVNKLPDPEQ